MVKPEIAHSGLFYAPERRARFTLLNEMWVEPGSYADWQLLHHLHYKGEGRPIGPRYWRLQLQGETIGVVAVAVPKTLLKERHKLFPKFAPNNKESTDSNRWRFQWINKNIRVIARIVLDTRFRGVGASYRLQNLVGRMSGFRIVEIQSSMSKYNAFASRAGFTMVKPLRSNKYATGVRFFRETFEAHPADTVGLLEEIRGLPTVLREGVLDAAREFYLKNSAMEKTGNNRFLKDKRVAALSDADLVRNLQQLVLASPLYGYYRNPDHGRELPERMPLSAFDRQPTNKPLILEDA